MGSAPTFPSTIPIAAMLPVAIVTLMTVIPIVPRGAVSAGMLVVAGSQARACNEQQSSTKFKTMHHIVILQKERK